MKTNQVRIIGGKWRSRKIDFFDSEGLRPTTDRLRETLFNWLQFSIRDKACLDAFAGSGVLGFEAISRGAGTVVMLEKNDNTAKMLVSNAEILKAGNLVIQKTDAIEYFKQTKEAFDIIFLDPPFQEKLILTCLEAIDENHLLKEKGKVYIEQPKEQGLNLPANWQIAKSSYAGHVSIYLIEKIAS